MKLPDRPSIQAETLELLEWPRLCQHLATFAATKLGAIAARHLPFPATKAASCQLLRQTKAACEMELRLVSGWSFEGINDIGEALERAERSGILSGAELLDIATTLAGMRRLRRAINSQEDLTALIDLIADIRTYPELEREIRHCLDDDGKVADRASPQLVSIRSRLKEVRERIYQKLQNILQRQGNAVQEAVITQRGDRFTIPVKATHREQIGGIIHDTSSTGATLYVEPNAVVELGNQLRQHHRQEQLEEERILKNLTEQVTAVVPDLERLLAAATAIDLANAKAKYSLWLEANPPRFIEVTAGESINLRQLRHPLLIWQQRHEQGVAAVPIDVTIPPNIRTVTITGPNTGGKTVTLKTLGLAALMAKAGLFVPAKEPVELPWFTQVLADIGDEQSLEQNLSTFSSHVRRIARILAALDLEEEAGDRRQEAEGRRQEAGGNFIVGNSHISASFPPPAPPAPPTLPTLPTLTTSSLVLLDEIGAGTDPAEGSALAIALLQYLASRAWLTVATTHYGELKALKYQDSRFENASVEFDDGTLSPTYRLLWGIPGRSNALAIAGRLGLHQEIVEIARQRLGGFAEDINAVIAGLEQQRREQEEKAKEASQLLQQTERFYQEVSKKAAALQERERTLKQQQELAVQQAIAAAKAEIAQVIRQLQQGGQTAQNAQKATDSLNQIVQQYLPVPEKPPASYQPQVGEKVKIPRFGQVAEVLEVDAGTEEVTVRFGLMKMTVPLTDIESLDGKKVEVAAKAKAPAAAPAPPTTAKPAVMVRTSQNTVDLRGNRIAEAEVELESAIRRAVASGVLWVIHGKGTGRLREGIHEFLSRHPQVERFELAAQNEGGSGVTVVYF